ncbi:MAG TPA: PilZ domain-containing protein [Candidatus Acidoferrum sp.]|nr:PilZ domain-containing protein [Candidatus Acidoferrum sp.]
MIERPRARRFPFAATIELVHMQTELEIREQTMDLSMYGCQTTAQKPWIAGTKVRLRIFHRGAIFAAQARVVGVRRSSMGVAFTRIEPKDQVVLEKWLAEARDTHERIGSAR